MKKCILRRSGGCLGEEVWSRTDTESLGASGAEDEDSVPDQGRMVGVKKNNGWRTIRNIVRFTPFMNTFRKRLYPWVQVITQKDQLTNKILLFSIRLAAKCYRRIKIILVSVSVGRA